MTMSDNNADINNDSIDNGVEGSAVRVDWVLSSASRKTSVLTLMRLIWAAATLTRTGSKPGCEIYLVIEENAGDFAPAFFMCFKNNKEPTDTDDLRYACER